MLNADRSSNAVSTPLTLNLAQSNGTGSCVGSIGHSRTMQQSGYIWHTNPSYPQASFSTDICIAFSLAGENVGQASSSNELSSLQELNQLMMSEQHSPQYCAVAVNHACNILNPSFHQVGIGIVQDSKGGTWLTEDFTN